MLPTNRLIFWTAVIGIPFTLLGMTLPITRPVSFAALAAFAIVAAGDALVGRKGFSAIAITLPEVVRLQKDRKGEFNLRIQNEQQRPMNLRIGFALPAEIQAEQEDLHI